MNIIKRIYHNLTTEIRMLYEDLTEGYVGADSDLLDLVIIGAVAATMIIIFMSVTGTAGDMAL